MEGVTKAEVDTLSELAASTLAGFAQLASTSTLPEPTISVTRCSNCATENTTLWRRSAETGATLCNACALYWKMKGKTRPISLAGTEIKRRNRSRKSVSRTRVAREEEEIDELAEDDDDESGRKKSRKVDENFRPVHGLEMGSGALQPPPTQYYPPPPNSYPAAYTSSIQSTSRRAQSLDSRGRDAHFANHSYPSSHYPIAQSNRYQPSHLESSLHSQGYDRYNDPSYVQPQPSSTSHHPNLAYSRSPSLSERRMSPGPPYLAPSPLSESITRNRYPHSGRDSRGASPESREESSGSTSGRLPSVQSLLSQPPQDSKLHPFDQNVLHTRRNRSVSSNSSDGEGEKKARSTSTLRRNDRFEEDDRRGRSETRGDSKGKWKETEDLDSLGDLISLPGMNAVESGLGDLRVVDSESRSRSRTRGVRTSSLYGARSISSRRSMGGSTSEGADDEVMRLRAQVAELTFQNGLMRSRIITLESNQMESMDFE